MTLDGQGLLVLVDPVRTSGAEAARIGRAAKAAGVRGLLIGSSFDGAAQTHEVARALRANAPGIPVAVSRLRYAAHRSSGSHPVPVARVGSQSAVSDRGARPRGAVSAAASGADAVHRVHPHRWRARDERRVGEPDAPSPGRQARAGCRACHRRHADRDASGLPRRGQRGGAPRFDGRDSGVPGGRAAAPPVRGWRHSHTGAGARCPARRGRLRGHRYRHRGRTPGRSRGLRRGGEVSAEVTRIRESLDGLATLAGRVAAEQADAIAVIADRYEATLRGGGTLFFAGNGGSAADAQHVATEYVVRYQTNRPAMRAVALTTDTSLLTAW